MDEALRKLLSPVRAGRLKLRNRVVMPAHTTNFAVGGLFSEQHLAYYRARAAGGVGMIITEGMRVHPTSLGRPTTVAAFDDAVVASLTALRKAVHAEGAKLAAQILHVGRQAGGHSSLSATWGASPIPWSGVAAVPHEMTEDEIAQVVDGFAAAAARADAAGIDAIEFHLGHGHLLQQFLSPASNHRTDRYGGSLDNRLRFAREVLDASLGRTSTELPLIVRISGDEFLDSGLDVTQMIEVVGLLQRDYNIDVLHVSHSAYVASGSVATQIADMSFEPAAFVQIPHAFSQAFPDLTVLAVCRMDTLERAAQVVASGAADLVGLARAHIATPDLVARAAADTPVPRTDCIACNQGCAGRLELGLPISCVVNPEVGQEREWRALKHAARVLVPTQRRRVLIAGAGPAGLNAAVAAAEAGHVVVLRDRAPEPGGTLRSVMQLPTRRKFAVLVEQLFERAHALGASLEFGVEVTAADAAHHWNEVIVATGGRPVQKSADAAFLPVSVADLASNPAAGGDHVLIVDEVGGWGGLALSDRVISSGRRATLVCAQPALAWRVPVYSKPALLARLSPDAFAVELLSVPMHRDGADVICRNTISGRETVHRNVTATVFLRPPRPLTELATALRRSGQHVTVIGDAYAPRSALEAAFEGRRAGFEISGSLPGVQAASMNLRGRL